jgi:hypothetical protein
MLAVGVKFRGVESNLTVNAVHGVRTDALERWGHYRSVGAYETQLSCSKRLQPVGFRTN